MNPLLRYGLVALAVAALFFAHRVIVKREAAKAFHEGTITERADWLARESKELNEKNREIWELQEKYRALENRSAELVADVANRNFKEIQRVEAQRDSALRDRDAYRLRWTTSCTASQAGGGSAAPAPGAVAGGAVGTASCELPREVTDNLIRLASDADKVTAERNALLEIAKGDREVCR